MRILSANKEILITTYAGNGGTEIIVRFKTLGDRKNPAVLFFHAMGVVGESSEPVAEYLADKYFCIMPTSTVYSKGQRYEGKSNEIFQLEKFLHDMGVCELTLVVASSLGADLAMEFLARTELKVGCVFFDGGQFAQIGKNMRRIMTPLLYLMIKSLYWSGGGTLKFILWCDKKEIRPYFVEAARVLSYGNLRRQLADSLENKPFLRLSRELEERTYFEFGSAEEHFKYRNAVMRAYPGGHFPVFEGYKHMQYQICDSEGFAAMLKTLAEEGRLPELPFLRRQT